VPEPTALGVGTIPVSLLESTRSWNWKPLEGFPLLPILHSPGAVEDLQAKSSYHYRVVTLYHWMKTNVGSSSPSPVPRYLIAKQPSGGCDNFRDHLDAFPSPSTSMIGNNGRTSLRPVSASTTSRLAWLVSTRSATSTLLPLNDHGKGLSLFYFREGKSAGLATFMFRRSGHSLLVCY
jgi:hypothetical protein